MKKKINNYQEYQKRLKEFFSGINEMPSSEEVQSFIDEYDLFMDWQIIIPDVKKDISSLMLKKIAGKSKFISSYKQYLLQLKKSFGIPNEMPSRKQIEGFIEEYSLEKSWGIVEEDVVKDLEEIKNGKYDDMLKDSTYINYGRLYGHTHYSPNVSVKLQNTPKEEKRKGSSKISKTKHIIFIDGDNHINEGQKGIEHTKKDIEVIAFFSQQGAKHKFDKKYQNRPNVSSKLVSPGDQAVDNQIKTVAGQILKKGKNQEITIVSHDNGFVQYKNRKNDRNSGNRISVVKSVKEGI